MESLIKEREGQENELQQVILAPQLTVRQNMARSMKRLLQAISPIHGRSGGVLKKREYPNTVSE